MTNTPIGLPDLALGIAGWDLVAPEPLLPTVTPFRWSLADADRNARRAQTERCETEARIARETETALADWRAFREQHADNLIVTAVLDMHQPEAGPRGVVCTECLDDDCDGATAAEWTCGTYNAMQEATRA